MSSALKRCCCCCCNRNSDEQQYDKVSTTDNSANNSRAPSPAKNIVAPPSSAPTTGLPPPPGTQTPPPSPRGSPRHRGKDGAWEQDLLYKKILSSGLIQYAAIVSFPEGVIRGANFAVDKNGVSAVIKALQGDTDHIVEGIKLSSELPVYIPGKLDPHRTIYATEIPIGGAEGSANGGCTITKVDGSVLIATYEKDGSAATRLIEEIALKIQKQTLVV